VNTPVISAANDFSLLLQNILTGKKVLGSSAGHGKGKATKESSSVTMKAADTATSAGNRGRKRKTDLTQQDHEHPPAKRGKALPADQGPVPQRLGVVVDPIKRRNTNKRTSEAADMAQENDPKTPVPSKKAKIGRNAPIRRTGKPVFFSAQMKLIKN
jgi:hypothetical protein